MHAVNYSVLKFKCGAKKKAIVEMRIQLLVHTVHIHELHVHELHAYFASTYSNKYSIGSH